MATTKITSNSLADSAVTSEKLASSISIDNLSVSGNLTVDTDTLVVDSVNNRVGIGTSNPIGSLHTAGSSTTSEFLGLFVQDGITPQNSATGNTVQNKMLSVQGVNGAFFHGRDITNSIDFVFGSSIFGEAFAGAMSSHNFSLRTNNANRLTVRASSGDVGIGTTSPSARLHTVSTTEQVRFGYDVSNYWNATTSSTGVTTLSAAGSGAKFVFANDVEFGANATIPDVVGNTSFADDVEVLGNFNSNNGSFAITNATIQESRIDLTPEERPTAKSAIFTRRDTSFANGNELYIGVSNFGGGGRIRFGGILTTSGSPTTCYSINFANVARVESFPANLGMQLQSSELYGTNVSVINNVTGGSNGFVIATNANGVISNPHGGTLNPNLAFKSYNSDTATFRYIRPEAYTFDTNADAASMTLIEHTKWKVANADIMTLSPSGDLTVSGNVDATSATIPDVIGNTSFTDDVEVLGALTVPNQSLDNNSGIITKGLLGLSSIINPLIYIINDNPVTGGLNFSNSSGAWRFGGWELNLNSVASGTGARQRYYISRSIASITAGWSGTTTRDFKFWSSGVFASRNLSHISGGQGNVRARIQFGNIQFEYSENPAFTKSGLAIEFLLDSGNYVVRLVYHDGTSYKTSDYHIINASTTIFNRHCAFVLRCNGGGEYSLWLNQAVDNVTLPVIPNPLTTTAVITITDGPTNLMGANPTEQFAFVKTNNSTSGGTSTQASSRLMNWVMSIDN